MKKLICVLLSIITVLSLCVCAFADGQVIRNVNDVWNIGEGAEPAIYKATLYTDGTGKDVYCIVCDGMDLASFDPNDARSITNATKISLSVENNTYVKTVCSAILNNIDEENASLVFLGRSMGGMVVQQVIAQSCIKDNYDILYSLAVGSPYILTKQSKEGVLRRVIDKLDIVPYLSITGLANPCIGNVSAEISGVFPFVHFNGYKTGACWRKYDCLGVKGGNAYLELSGKIA